jgi:predicted TIM-barrel fold metal-dependent hydrolase
LSYHPDETPAFQPPAHACDSHFHVFGPAARYPYVSSQLRYAPPLAPLSDYLQLARLLGLTRFVFVQPSAYGRDNRCMLDAMREVGVAHCRGVVDIDEDTPDAALAEMDALGVRGVRINVSPVHSSEPGLAQAMTPRIRRLAARCAELGWHLDFLLPGWLTAELMPVLKALKIPFSMAHMGMNLARDGVDAPGFKALLELVAHGERLAYVKFTGIYRMSKLPRFTDADPLARALIDAAPDRLIWGSDYPHLSFGENSSVELFNLLARWTDDPKVREQILAKNPARLFGFR